VNDKFIEWLIKHKCDNKIFLLGFIFAFTGYSFWKPLEEMLDIEQEGSVYYICISISFFFYTFAYFLTKYNTWRFFPMFVSMVCLARVIQEIFYPEAALTYDWLEYLYFVLTIFIVFGYYLKYQFGKFKNSFHKAKKS